MPRVLGAHCQSGGQLRHNRDMDSVIVRDSAIMSGAPTFRGTRVLVRTLFDYLEAGHSLERFLEGFPTVSREQALQALESPRPGEVVRIGIK